MQSTWSAISDKLSKLEGRGHNHLIEVTYFNPPICDIKLYVCVEIYYYYYWYYCLIGACVYMYV